MLPDGETLAVARKEVATVLVQFVKLYQCRRNHLIDHAPSAG